MSIYIFSRPIHSGKTTALLQWCNLQKNIAGVLMPDVNDSRKILNLSTKEIFDAECVDLENTNEPRTSIGKYHFYTKAFAKANSILQKAIRQKPYWLVIDEVGKLELKGAGFCFTVAEAVKEYDNEYKYGKLLLTVRDSLCDEVILFFGIKHYKVIDSLKELT
jgi:nucleoside-triphosphatase THEP1